MSETIRFTQHACDQMAIRAQVNGSYEDVRHELVSLMAGAGRTTDRPPRWLNLNDTQDRYLVIGEWLVLPLALDVRGERREWHATTVVTRSRLSDPSQRGSETPMSWEEALAGGWIKTVPRYTAYGAPQPRRSWFSRLFDGPADGPAEFGAQRFGGDVPPTQKAKPTWVEGPPLTPEHRQARRRNLRIATVVAFVAAIVTGIAVSVPDEQRSMNILAGGVIAWGITYLVLRVITDHQHRTPPLGPKDDDIVQGPDGT